MEEEEQEDLSMYGALLSYVSGWMARIANCFFGLRYDGYNKDLIDRFCNMGFDVDRVVAAFKDVGIDRMDGEDYELEEAYMGDITAYLLGEP